MKLSTQLTLLLAAGLFGLYGCGGGGGSSAPPPTTTPVAKTTTTISGKVEFPSLTSLVAKQTPKEVEDPFVSVQAYTLEGNPVGTAVVPKYEDTIPGSVTDFTKRTYFYSLPDIPIGRDYIVRAKCFKEGKTQELKKVIEKKEVGDDPLIGQDISSISTTAVVIASQKLTVAMGTADNITLGDPLPALGGKTVADLSDAIVKEVVPKSLEVSIQAAQKKVSDALTSGTLATSLSSMTDEERKELVDLVNVSNIVTVAVANNSNPSQILAGGAEVQLSTAAGDKPLKLLSVSDDGKTVKQADTATPSITQSVIKESVTSAGVTCIPPRVRLDFSTDATSLYGITVEVILPAHANIRFDATGKFETILLSVPAGTYVDAQYTKTTSTLRVTAVSGYTPLPAKFLTLNFDRTPGVNLKTADFKYTVIEKSDSKGQKINENISLEAVSSGF